MANVSDNQPKCLIFFYNHKEQQNNLESIANEISELLGSKGILWIFSEDIYDKDKLNPYHFHLGNFFQNNGFFWKDIVAWYNVFDTEKPLPIEQRYKIILLFSKQKGDFSLNIDRVREKSIWKGQEWGGGRESRYHEKGKNPSNLWLKQESKNGKIKKHIILDLQDVVRRCVLLSTSENDEVIINKNEHIDKIKNIIAKLNRDIQIKNFDFENGDYNFSELGKHHLKPPKHDETTNSILDESKIYFNSSENMQEVPPDSIQTIVTSPPYWGLRDYDSKEQIGFNEEYEDYLNRISRVFSECYRVLKKNGTFWLNINKRKIKGDILNIPGDLFSINNDIGFFLKDIIFWHRAISVPHNKNLLTNRLEYILIFSKDKNEIRFYPERCNWKDYEKIPNSNLTNVWRLYRKFGSIGKEISRKLKDKEIKHTAVYPKELVRRAVLLSTNRGDYVLDPFMGSGTTAVVASKLGRNWLGYEINKDYKSIIDWRLREEGVSLDKWVQD